MEVIKLILKISLTLQYVRMCTLCFLKVNKFLFKEKVREKNSLNKFIIQNS